jgi:hypothetical protein
MNWHGVSESQPMNAPPDDVFSSEQAARRLRHATDDKRDCTVKHSMMR